MLSRGRRAKDFVRLREPTDDFLLKSLVPLVLLLFASGPLGGWGHVPAWITGLAWLVVAILAAMLVRSWRVGVLVRRDGVEIVGYTSRTKLEWTEVSGFEFGYPEARFWKWAPVLVTTAGVRIPMNAIQAPQPWTRPANDFDKRAVAKLEELLRQSKSSGGAVADEDLMFDSRFGH